MLAKRAAALGRVGITTLPSGFGRKPPGCRGGISLQQSHDAQGLLKRLGIRGGRVLRRKLTQFALGVGCASSVRPYTVIAISCGPLGLTRNEDTVYWLKLTVSARKIY